MAVNECTLTRIYTVTEFEISALRCTNELKESNPESHLTIAQATGESEEMDEGNSISEVEDRRTSIIKDNGISLVERSNTSAVEGSNTSPVKDITSAVKNNSMSELESSSVVRDNSISAVEGSSTSVVKDTSISEMERSSTLVKGSKRIPVNDAQNNEYYVNAIFEQDVHLEREFILKTSSETVEVCAEDSDNKRENFVEKSLNETTSEKIYCDQPSYVLRAEDAMHVVDLSLLDEMQSKSDTAGIQRVQEQICLPRCDDMEESGAEQLEACLAAGGGGGGSVCGVGDSQFLPLSTSEPCHDSSAFIGPMPPSFFNQDTRGCIKEIAETSNSRIPGLLAEARLASDMMQTGDLRYNLSVNSVPRLIAAASTEFQGASENFLRGCKWSPDGSAVLTNSNDNYLRIFCPYDDNSSSDTTDIRQIPVRVKMKECSQIYDFAWHPKMSTSHPDYCRIACTCSGIPIQLLDAANGKIVANYRAYDQFDEITAAYSLSFSPDGSKIYAGYSKTIRIFDTDYPVRSCKTIKTYNAQRKDGQSGIISCFAYSPDGNGLYAAGSYSRHIGIYDSACDRLVCLMQGQHGGVTHLMFSPDSTKLYSGGRKDAEILCWDVRNMAQILFSALRDVKTNQRIYFDLSQSGRYLVSGNNDGSVAFWDTLSSVEEINGDNFLKPCSQFQAHGDCVNGVSFNHHHNMIATASGQRHFHNFDHDSSDSEEDESMEDAGQWDFSLRLWQIPLMT